MRNRTGIALLSLAALSLPVMGGEALGGGGLNPASPGLPAVDNVYQGQPGAIVNNRLSAMCVSCHGPVPSTGRTGHFVTHFSTRDGANRTTTATGKSTKERTAAWTGSGYASKYGNLTTWLSDNTATGEMICESCHSIRRNVAGGNNLLESSLPGDNRPAQPNTLASATTTLCEGCHVSGTLPGHHALTGDALSDGSTLSTADTGFTRGYVSADTEMGGAGSEVKYPAANRLPCLSCHGNGHTGFTGTGARILRRGYGRPPPPGAAVTGLDNTGIDRQQDYDATGTNRLISNFTPMCDSCHKVND